MGTVVQCGVVLHHSIPSVRRLSNIVSVFQKAALCFERIFDVLDLPQELAVQAPRFIPPTPAPTGAGNVSFRGVSFSYANPQFDEVMTLRRATTQTGKLDARKAKGAGAPAASPSSTATPMASPASSVAASPDDTESFSHVTKRDALVLHDVSFELAAGERVALCGHTGSGKSTIAQLLARLRDPTEGDILVDGVSLKRVAPEDMPRLVGECLWPPAPRCGSPIHARFTCSTRGDVLPTTSTHPAFMPQESYLLNDTIAANLRYARPDATLEELESAAKAAGIHDTIAKLPKVRQHGCRQLRAFAILGGDTWHVRSPGL